MPTSMETAFTPAGLSFLTWTHRARHPSPCRVCGSPLRIGEMRAGSTTYHCDSPEADFIEVGRPRPEDTEASRRARREEAESHFRRSEEVIGYAGDSTIARLVTELRGMRIDRGEDMSVPVGEMFYPDGHGRGLCRGGYRHLGADQWERVFDDYAHDPSHADMVVEEPVED